MIEIWFEPHATSLDNQASKASGWNDIDLAPLGLTQAKEMVERTKERQIDLIFCSDLQRAIKTALPSAECLKLPIYPDSRLRECDYGDMTQQDSSVVSAEKKARISQPFPNGESYEQTAKRIEEFLIYLKKNFDGKKVLIIGHRATQYGLDLQINGRPTLDSVTAEWHWQPGWRYELN